MPINIIAALLSQPYDCLLLVHPYIQILEKLSTEIQELGLSHLNISKGLSTSLMTVSSSERSRFSQKWLLDTLATFQRGPILCSCLDLLFDPPLNIDPLSLIRQAARTKQLIVLWPGEYSVNTLSYAVPGHHHFRTWKVPDSLLRQPVVLIHQISALQGA